MPKNKESKGLNIEAMDKAAESVKKDYEDLPFLWVKAPEGDTRSAYRVEIVGDFRKFTGKQSGIVHDCIDVKILEVVNDAEAPKGKASMELKAVLKSKLEEIAKTEPLKGRVFDISNRGKPKGKKYYDFIVLSAVGALRLPTPESW